ncbi:bacitracin ABC transporter ATP-binding protein [Terribacillus saccharophilus]|uniref:Bacitracin ABC transporter ATP-binding protein n=1 Tax=Terribacillus saccharophilus TaxID=361277 RepID=A0A268H9T4_9BACI|nr:MULTISPECIES: ABC transporter ATP-binding protein [Terribacillus]PAD33586.1 bacitracin ABC transporter ATP-binding protein [Terribacillus saccharophilus]PAD94353.1 bacitracin ABC transporter ATP-binding protein [Terribacillus saccharophilus]PAD98099.1 bacitracin ABC transporter ATP-binding protein [Terribacillus saccharophilus]PAE06629.1 bacitracin ABC transporter ATP-binding protein [Terribacillus saccharophilus]
MLKLTKVSKIYEGKVAYRALTDIDLEVEKGEFVAIMGPSGSGKTTLLNIISTNDAPTTGQVEIDGQQPHQLKKNALAKFRRNQLGFIFQDFNLLHTLTVQENIILPLTLDGVRASEMQNKAQQIAKSLGIGPIMNKRTYEISGGQAQRVAIARAMIHEPKMLLADEPTGNLDSKAAKDVMKMLVSINERNKTSLLMVTHDPQAASYSDRVVFIRDGKLHSEIHRGESRQAFFQKIIDMLSLMGGEGNEFSSIRV